MMLTDERVAEIRARLAAATPGPWGPPRMIGAQVAVDFGAAAPTDLADLLPHADALAAENRRLRAALASIAGTEERPSCGQYLGVGCMRAADARRALEGE